MPQYRYTTTVKAPTGVALRFDTDATGTAPAVICANPQGARVDQSHPRQMIHADQRDGSIQTVFGDAATVYVRQIDYKGNVVAGVITTIAGVALADAVSATATRSRTGPGVSAAVPVGAVSRVSTGNTPQQTSTGTSETPLQLNFKATNLRFLLGNISVVGFVDTVPAAALTLGAGLNVGTQAAPQVHPMRVGGKQTIVLDPGAMVWTDPIPIDVDPSVTVPRARIFNGSNWFPNAYSQIAGSGGFTATTDLTAANTVIAEATSATFLSAPLAVYGEPLGAPCVIPTTLVLGDSIGYGLFDGVGQACGINTATLQLGGGGYISRGLSLLSGVVNLTTPSETATSWLTFANRRHRAALLNSCANVICEYGLNDLLNSSRTDVQLEADLLAIWTSASNRGCRVFQTTITPKTTSTDGWVTTANQAVASPSGEIYRQSVNAWLRAGAPIDVNTKAAVAVGTAGALLAGVAGHPLYGVLDVSTIVESPLVAGVFRPADNVRNTVGTLTVAAGSATVNDTAGAFTTADLGRTITIPGGGAAGALYRGQVIKVNSASQVVTGTNVTTAVTNGNGNYGDTWTVDGTHYSTYGHLKAAAALAGMPLTV